MNNFYYDNYDMTPMCPSSSMNWQSTPLSLPVPPDFFAAGMNNQEGMQALQFQYDCNPIVNSPFVKLTADSVSQLAPLNDLSQYWFGDCHLNKSQGLAQNEVAQPSYLPDSLAQTIPNGNISDKRRNQIEYDREQEIEALTLDKDEKYFHLLKPYHYQRVQHGDNIVRKVTYTYICKYDNCNKTFAKACNFLDHVRMHEGIKPYSWSRCSKEFVQKCNLKKHFKRHLTKTLDERKVYKCSICQKGFTERYNLKTHMKMHS